MVDELGSELRPYLAASYLDAVTADPRAPKPPARARAAPLSWQQRIERSEHDVACRDAGVLCLKCGSTVGKSSAKKWLLSKCEPLHEHSPHFCGLAMTIGQWSGISAFMPHMPPCFRNSWTYSFVQAAA